MFKSILRLLASEWWEKRLYFKGGLRPIRLDLDCARSWSWDWVWVLKLLRKLEINQYNLDQMSWAQGLALTVIIKSAAAAVNHTRFQQKRRSQTNQQEVQELQHSIKKSKSWIGIDIPTGKTKQKRHKISTISTLNSNWRSQGYQHGWRMKI